MNVKNKRIVVVGLGLTGRACVSFLVSQQAIMDIISSGKALMKEEKNSCSKKKEAKTGVAGDDVADQSSLFKSWGPERVAKPAICN